MTKRSNMGFENWVFEDVVPATSEHVTSAQKMASFLDPKDQASVKTVTLGEPLARIIMKDDSHRDFSKDEIRDYFEIATKNPDQKGHQIEALTQAVKALGVNTKPPSPSSP